MIRVCAVVAVAVAALLVSGCGGDDDGGGSEASAPETWAGEVCSAVTTWRGSITSLADTVQQSGLTRESLETAVDDAKGATEQLADDLQGLGAPDTEAGEEAKQLVDEAADGVRDDVSTMEDAVDDASGAGGVLNAVSVVSATLAAMGQRITTTVTQIQGLDAAGELEDAFEQAPACETLR